jgi:hypothetical protein
VNKKLMVAAALAVAALSGGCVVYPVYDSGYYGPAVIVPPPPVIFRPYYGGRGYYRERGYYGDRDDHHDHGHHRR